MSANGGKIGGAEWEYRVKQDGHGKKSKILKKPIDKKLGAWYYVEAVCEDKRSSHRAS